MAGEWIPIDCNLGTKPEVLELVDVTGESVETVGWRLIQLWSWAAMNTADGQIVATPRRLAAVAGGDEAFWRAVEAVGWISFAGTTMTIAGWEKRFSQAAKARAENARRACAYRARKARPEERRREDKTEEKYIPAAPVPTSKPAKPSRSPAKPRVHWDCESGWQNVTDADRQEWAEAFPGAVLDQELAKATAWLKANPTKARRSNWRRFLVGWLQRCQDKGGTDRQQTGRRPEDKPPPKRWLDEYQPTGYRRPREAVALASTLKLKTEDT